MTELMRPSKLRAQLARITTPDDALDVAGLAARAKRIYEAIGRSLAECNEYAEIYLEAYWKFGDLVGGIAPHRPKAHIDVRFPGTRRQRSNARLFRNGVEEQSIPDYVKAATDKLEAASLSGCLEWVTPPGQPAVRGETVWPDGKHGVILADPPWRPDEGLLDPTRRIENQYPTMTLAEMVALRPKVDALAADDCVLVMWTTTQKLSEATALVDAWGFTVKSGAVWVKNSIGMGYWFRGRHELIVLATRGTPPTPLEGDRPDSVITAARRGHSQKPDEVYALLDRMFPRVPKVEIFARAERAGWSRATNESVLRSA
jgi:N6-adenosine-specific RNA methylase IME4